MRIAPLSVLCSSVLVTAACLPVDGGGAPDPSNPSMPATPRAVLVDEGKGVAVELQRPYPADRPLTPVVKPGAPLDVVGTARGPSFKRYTIEWARGRLAPETAWSAAGVALEAAGASQVTDGLLGRWTPPAGAAGDHLLRLAGWNGADSTGTQAVVHLEPDLLNAAWPQYVGSASAGHAALPARAADGKTWFVTCGYASDQGTTCRATAADGGSYRTLALVRGSEGSPVAGDIDGQPGDEVVIPDGTRLRIVAPDLTPRREIAIPDGVGHVSDYETVLADLDGDRVLEIVSLVFLNGFGGAVHVYRGGGTTFATGYPLALASPEAPRGFERLELAVLDLDGEGGPEIVVLGTARDALRAVVLAYRAADASPLAYWTAPAFSVMGYASGLRAADLEHDGRPELLFWEQLDANNLQLRVLDANGATRPGWPSRAATFIEAIGDLDRDGVEEIVSRGPDGALTVLRPDGSKFGPAAWPVARNHGSAVIADLDDDGYPDVVVCDDAGDGTMALKAVSRAGAVVRSWRLFGMNGRPPAACVPGVGEFSNDGLVDVVVHVGLNEPGTGALVNGAVTVLTTGKPYNPARADWPLPNADPQNSSQRKPAPPVGSPDGGAGDGGPGNGDGGAPTDAAGPGNPPDAAATDGRAADAGAGSGDATPGTRLDGPAPGGGQDAAGGDRPGGGSGGDGGGCSCAVGGRGGGGASWAVLILMVAVALLARTTIMTRSMTARSRRFARARQRVQ
jgi:hypothetical protein